MKEEDVGKRKKEQLGTQERWERRDTQRDR